MRNGRLNGRATKLMAGQVDDTRFAAQVLDADEVQGVLSGAFYGGAHAGPPASPPRRPSPKPDHYKVICISLYTRDLDRLDGLVSRLKERGMTKASRSALIRAALEQVDLDKVPRGV
jgi:hypothetical protein